MVSGGRKPPVASANRGLTPPARLKSSRNCPHASLAAHRVSGWLPGDRRRFATGPPAWHQGHAGPQDVPPKPEEAVKRFKLPEGFHVTLFAGEPYVCQPISMAFDDRGRLWVAECFSYPNWVSDPKQGRDRILIFEDTDGDGKFDKRTVFWDRAYNLTSIQIGHGGVWALCAPHLLFIPYKDGEDKPIGKPQVVLD